MVADANQGINVALTSASDIPIINVLYKYFDWVKPNLICLIICLQHKNVGDVDLF